MPRMSFKAPKLKAPSTGQSNPNQVQNALLLAIAKQNLDQSKEKSAKQEIGPNATATGGKIGGVDYKSQADRPFNTKIDEELANVITHNFGSR